MRRLISLITRSFARKINRSPTLSHTQQQLSQSSQIPILKSPQLSIQKQLEDQIEPLSYDKQVQDSLRAKVAQELKYSYEGQDPNPHKLVHRPSKGAAWGLGGQLMLASRKVQLQGLMADSETIIQFLQLHQVKNIYLHDFFAQNPDKPDTNRRRYHIIGSCFSAKHCWKTAIQLKNAFNLNSAKSKLRRRIQYDPIFAVMNGGKDEEWAMVQYKEYQISLMTEQQREAIDLQWKWTHPVSEEIMQKHMEMKLMKKGRKRQFQDFQ